LIPRVFAHLGWPTLILTGSSAVSQILHPLSMTARAGVPTMMTRSDVHWIRGSRLAKPENTGEHVWNLYGVSWEVAATQSTDLPIGSLHDDDAFRVHR